MTVPISLGDRVRLTAHPKAPVLTVESLYLQGAAEELHASCSWSTGDKKQRPQLVHFPVAELEPEGRT
jgi:hypothetical protein